MTALLLWFLANPTVIAVLAGIVAAFGWGVKQRRAGAAAERAKQAEAEAKARDIADQVDSDIGALTPEQRREALKRWGR